jgi:probable F420-dependent oxidoreductase
VSDPRPALGEVPDAEALGLGSVWISERHDVKEAATLCGAAAALTREMGIATGVTNTNTRHVMVTAAFGATMARLTDGRFTLGFGRGFDQRSAVWGLPLATMARMEDTATLLRRLWTGEKVFGHDGPAGKFAYLSTDIALESPPPLAIAALGPKTQRWAGRVFDAVLLHSHWTPRAVAESVQRIRKGAEEAGRDPQSVKVWTCLVTACDLPEEVELPHVVRRMTTYMQIPGYGELIVNANGWDPGVLEKVRSHALLQGRLADATQFTTDELRQLREIYPEEWFIDSNAVGLPEACAERILADLDAGADGVVLHASAPREMGDLIDAWSKIRPGPRFAGRSSNPGA